MNAIIEFLSQPWHWAVSGFMIATTMVLLLLSGERFGVSTSFNTVCSMAGAGKLSDQFRVDWKKQIWLLVFVGGAIIGGYIASHQLQSPQPVQISGETVAALHDIGVDTPRDKSEGLGYVPEEIFTLKNVATLPGFIIMVVGGFLIGFGTRWASGCTSGHAISGLSNLRPTSLVAVIGFFIGGLISTHFLLPIILSL